MLIHATPHFALALDLTNYSVRLDHVTYLTRDLDSLTKVFQKRGFIVTAGDSRTLDVMRHFVNLPDGTYIELQSTSSIDTADWRVKALTMYGDHIASISFQVPNLDAMKLTLDSASIAVGEYLEERYEGDLLWRAFGIEGIHPLDIVFIERKQDLIELPIEHPNNHRKLDWVIFATNKENEQPLRDLFAALHLTMRHEGWFDYWMIGPPERRLSMRIGPPYNERFKATNGIFIEENGLVFAY